MRLKEMMAYRVSGNNFYYITHQVPKAASLVPNLVKSAKKRFVFSLFETDRCPSPWVKNLNYMDETWVFSDFNRDTFRKSGVIKVEKIPFGVDSKIFSPLGPKMEFNKKENDFVFITSGDFTERKNFEGLIEAFVKEFNSSDDVCLVVKAHYGGFTKQHKEACAQRLRDIVFRFNPVNPPRVLFLSDKVPYDTLGRFYRAGVS